MEKSKRNKTEESKKRLAIALKRNLIRRKQKQHNTTKDARESREQFNAI